jgi:hypothetical protein
MDTKTKQTAVEWLFAHLLPHLDWSKTEDRIKFRQLEQVALDMEKEQTIKAVDSNFSYDNNDYPTLGELYYQEHYGK